jgi:hypothetical protein
MSLSYLCLLMQNMLPRRSYQTERHVIPILAGKWCGTPLLPCIPTAFELCFIIQEYRTFHVGYYISL